MPGISNLETFSVEREEFFIQLYKKAFPVVAKYISRMGGSFDEAKDIFQDTLVIYYEKRIAAKLSLNTSDTAYLVGIAKHLWVKRYHENNTNMPLDDIDIAIDEDEQALSGRRLMHFLETA